MANQGLADGLIGADGHGEAAPSRLRYPEHWAVAVLGGVADKDRAGGVPGLDALCAAVSAVAGLAPAGTYFCWLCQNVIASRMRVPDSATLRA